MSSYLQQLLSRVVLFQTKATPHNLLLNTTMPKQKLTMPPRFVSIKKQESVWQRLFQSEACCGGTIHGGPEATVLADFTHFNNYLQAFEDHAIPRVVSIISDDDASDEISDICEQRHCIAIGKKKIERQWPASSSYQSSPMPKKPMQKRSPRQIGRSMSIPKRSTASRETSESTRAKPRETSEPTRAKPRETSESTRTKPRETRESTRTKPRETREATRTKQAHVRKQKTTNPFDDDYYDPTEQNLRMVVPERRLLQLYIQNQDQPFLRKGPSDIPKVIYDTSLVKTPKRTRSRHIRINHSHDSLDIV